MVVRPARQEDVAWVAANLREEDREEASLSGLSASAAIRRSWERSRLAYAVYAEDGAEKPCALFGVTRSGLAGYGGAWFVATPEVKNIAKTLLSEMPRWSDHLAHRFPNGLLALAWEGNPLHIKWAEAVGFEQRDKEDHLITLIRPR